MGRHLDRVERLIARGDVAGAKVVHNAATVRAARRGGAVLRQQLPEIQQAKAALDAATTKK